MSNKPEVEEPIFQVREIPLATFKQRGRRRRLSHQDIQEDLAGIYQDQEGNLPNMARLERKKRSKFKIFIITFLAVFTLLAGLAWLGFFVLKGPNPTFTGERVDLEITAPESLASGEEVIYIIEYENREEILLRDVELAIRYPEGFIFKESKPYPLDESNSFWELGTILRGRHGKVEIKGQLVGEIEASKVLSAVLTFYPENFNAKFQEVVSVSTEITSSIMDLRIEGPEEILAGHETTYAIKYRNTSAGDLRNLKISATYPADFNYQESLPTPDRRNNVWFIDKLASKDKGSIDIKGDFFSSAEGEQEFIVLVEVKSTGENYEAQQEKSLITEVARDDFNVNLMINGSTENQSVNFGETLNYTVVYKNKGSAVLRDLELMVALDSGILDWFTLSDDNDGLVVDQQITWTKEQIFSLAELGPSEEGIIGFEINIIANPEEAVGSDYKITSQVKAKIGKAEEVTVDKEIASNIIVNQVNSAVSLKLQGRYYDSSGAVLGSGPLPPRVGQATTYYVYWEVANGIHEVKEGMVTASLGAGVSYLDSDFVGAGEMKYSAGQVVWEINRLPANYSGLKASFRLSLTPTEYDFGQVMTLMDNIAFSGVDKETGALIKITKPALNTELAGDNYAAGQGIVE